LLATAGGFLAMALKSSVPVWLAGSAAALVLLHKWHHRALVVLTREEVSRSRIAEGGALAVVIASLFS